MPSKGMPLAPKRDAPDYAKIAERLRSGETLRDVWRAYCKEVARPYAFRAFGTNVHIYIREDRKVEPLTSSSPVAELAESYNYALAYWSKLVSPVRTSLALGTRASLRMSFGRLQTFDHVQGERHFEPGGILPKSITMNAHAGLLTVPALKFCRDYGIAVSMLDEFGDLLSIIEPPGEIIAGLIRKQCAADPLPIARDILITKVKHSNAAHCLPDADAKRFVAALKQCGNVPDLIQIEGIAAQIYWNARACELRVRPYRGLPSAWKHFRARVSHIGTRSPRYATHPVNAMLNLAYHSAAGRLGAVLSAYGACLAIGFLHNDRRGRYSLVYDAIEPLRPQIDDLVFKFVSKNTFDRSDFLKLSIDKKVGHIRLAPALAVHVLQECALPQAEIDKAAKFMIDLISKA